MRAWGARGANPPETKAQRRERAAAGRRFVKGAIRAMDDAAKTALLARTIAASIACRHSFTERDGLQAGLTEAEVRRLYEPALAKARRIEPRLADMAATP